MERFICVILAKPKMDDGFCTLFAVESEPHCIYSIMLNSILLPLFSSHHANRSDVHIRIFTPIALLHAFSLSHDIKRVFRMTSLEIRFSFSSLQMLHSGRVACLPLPLPPLPLPIITYRILRYKYNLSSCWLSFYLQLTICVSQ